MNKITITFETSEKLTSDEFEMILETIMEVGGNKLQWDEEEE